jgi:hypothetical protein
LVKVSLRIIPKKEEEEKRNIFEEKKSCKPKKEI